LNTAPDARRNSTRARAPLIVLSPVQFSQLIGAGNLTGTRLVVGVLDAENVDLIRVAP
jgi:hypothetical protein